MADAKVVIQGDSSGAVRATKDVRNEFDKVPGSSQKATASIDKVGAALAVAAAGFATFKKAMDLATEAAEFERQSNRVTALIRTTGNTAQVTSKQIQAQARELGRTTLLNTEDVLDAQGILLTFKSVSGEVFNDTIALAADMSEVMGTDVRSATLQLAKALEEPTIGLTALRRSGISFNEQQKEQIQLLVENGKQFEAQRIILDVVSGQLGGVAVESAQGFAGSMDTLNESMRELRIELGERTIPILSQGANLFTRLADSVVESLGGRGFKADLLEEARALAKQTLGDAANELQIQSEIIRLLSNQQGIVFGTAELKRTEFESEQDRLKALEFIQELFAEELQSMRELQAADQTRLENARAEARERARINAIIAEGRRQFDPVTGAGRTDVPGETEVPTQLEETATATQILTDNMTDAEARAIQMGIAMQGIQSVGMLLANDFPNIGSGLEALFGRGSKAASAFFNVYKAAAIATTTVATYDAAQTANANAQKLFGPAGVILGPIAAGAEVVAGLAKVAKIRATKLGGGAPTGGGTESRPALNPSAVAPPRPSDTFVGPEGALFTAPPSDTPELVASVEGRDLVFFLTNTQTDLEKIAVG
jgi:hypothetical protein